MVQAQASLPARKVPEQGSSMTLDVAQGNIGDLRMGGDVGCLLGVGWN